MGSADKSAKQLVHAYAYNINTKQDYKSIKAKKINYTNKIMFSAHMCARTLVSGVLYIDLLCTQKLPSTLLWDICVEHKNNYLLRHHTEKILIIIFLSTLLFLDRVHVVLHESKSS